MVAFSFRLLVWPVDAHLIDRIVNVCCCALACRNPLPFRSRDHRVSMNELIVMDCCSSPGVVGALCASLRLDASNRTRYEVCGLRCLL